jgi:hypothetical protein
LVDALALISQQLQGVVGLEEQQRWRQQQAAEEQAAALLEAAQQAAAGTSSLVNNNSSSSSSNNGSMTSTSSSRPGSSRSSTGSAAPGDQVTHTQERAPGTAPADVQQQVAGQADSTTSAADTTTTAAAAATGPTAPSESDPQQADEDWDDEDEGEEEAPFTTPELQATEAGIAALDTALHQLQVARDALMEALPALDAYLQEHEAGAAQAAALSSRLELLQKLLRAQRVKSSEELLELTERHRQRLAAWYEAEGEGGAWGQHPGSWEGGKHCVQQREGLHVPKHVHTRVNRREIGSM